MNRRTLLSTALIAPFVGACSFKQDHYGFKVGDLVIDKDEPGLVRTVTEFVPFGEKEQSAVDAKYAETKGRLIHEGHYRMCTAASFVVDRPYRLCGTTLIEVDKAPFRRVYSVKKNYTEAVLILGWVKHA